MEVSSEKSKILVNNLPQTNIMLNGQRLEEVENFKYLGSTVTKDGSSTKEIKTRLGIASSARTRLNNIWKSNVISLPIKIKLFKSLVVSILLYGCESWTLTAETERRIEAFEYKSYRRLLRILYSERKTNTYVKEQITTQAGQQEPLLSIVKRRKLTWYGHTSRHNILSKTILQGSVEGKRRRGRQRKAWNDNIKECTGRNLSTLMRATENREEWKALTAQVTNAAPLRPSGSRAE